MIRSLAQILCFGIVLTSCNTIEAAFISFTSVTNTSSAIENTAQATFNTQSILSPVQSLGVVQTFSHRMAFVNTYIADGGAAQVHKRNVAFQLDFTVLDATNSGFEVDLSSFLRGISSVTLSALVNGTGSGTVTGANFAVAIDDSTDAPDTYGNLVSLFTDADGTQVSDILGTSTVDTQDTAQTSLGIYYGTTSFSLRFTTATTPTTNVIFGNNREGFGEIDFGLGSLAAAQSPVVDPAELGHFVTVTVTSLVPEPGFFHLAGIAILIAVSSRFRNNFIRRSSEPALSVLHR